MTANGTGGESSKDTGGPAQAAPAGAEGGIPVVVYPHRPWLPAAVVSLIAAAVLLILLIPGVLRYPPPLEQPAVPDPAARQARVDSNRALEERIASLHRLLDAGVCVADGSFQLPSSPAAVQSLTPTDRASLPPPPVNRALVPPTVPPANGQPFTGSLLDLLDKSTVLILQSEADGQMVSSGSGFLVAPGKVLTNRHVAEGNPGRRLHVINRALGVVPAKVQASSPNGEPGSPDFALLSIELTDRGVPLTVAPMAERLTNVVAAGFPSMVLATDDRFRRLLAGEINEAPTASVTEGIVTAVQQGNGANVVLHTAQITPGNSGGPLVDRCGRLLGINTYIMAREEGRMNYALASTDVVRFLTGLNVPVGSAEGPCNPPGPATPNPTATSVPGVGSGAGTGTAPGTAPAAPAPGTAPATPPAPSGPNGGKRE